jgi:hypothetical protein
MITQWLLALVAESRLPHDLGRQVAARTQGPRRSSSNSATASLSSDEAVQWRVADDESANDTVEVHAVGKDGLSGLSFRRRHNIRLKARVFATV